VAYERVKPTYILFCSAYRGGCDNCQNLIQNLLFFVIGFTVVTIMHFSYEIMFDNLVTPMEPV